MSARQGLALFIGLPLAFLLALVVLLRLDGGGLPAPDGRIVARVPSPDGRRTAIVAEMKGDATVGFGNEIRVGGEEAAMVYKPVRPDGTEGVEVRWLGANVLEVAFVHARFVRVGKVPGLRVVVKGKSEL